MPREPPRWQRLLGEAFGRPAELLEFLGLPADLPGLNPVQTNFPLRVPRAYAARMRKGDARDPLFLQVWARPEEALDVQGFVDDAVGDHAALRDGGILHKYEGRALVLATGACAIHCRYCFRQHFPYGDALASRDHWREALGVLAADRSLAEVILSGGDPLSLIDEKLAPFAESLEFLPQVKRLRLHTRLPVVLPERVDDALLGWLSRGRLRKVMVIHANHANELDADVAAALARLADAGVHLLNQSVLLRGVNDSVEALVALSERLSECGVMPYYLHMLDPVRGTAHFDVPEGEARRLVRSAAATLPGYLVPRLVREIPGAPAKAPVGG
ncbi:MAG TPA: EF-P beta-lysylation protein EpmB [Verrucomicrobiae bacterium]|nr:EF-P beta-lysylation protein EpmB [Verrucomicrobiae bacterium]